VGIAAVEDPETKNLPVKLEVPTPTLPEPETVK
jgi:hypothetical protein